MAAVVFDEQGEVTANIQNWFMIHNHCKKHPRFYLICKDERSGGRYLREMRQV